MSVSAPEDPQLFVISAATPDHLAKHLTNLAEAFEETAAPLSDLAYSLTSGRRRESACVSFVAHSRTHLLEKLKRSVRRVDQDQCDGVFYRAEPLAEGQRKIAFLFAGQGMRWPQSGSELCRRFPALKARVDAIAAALDAIREHTAHARAGAGRNGHQNRVSGMAKMEELRDSNLPFAAAQLAMSGFLADMGLMPHVAAGLGVGELIAATAGGILEEKEALRLVARLGFELHSSPSNGSSDALTLESMAALKILPPRIPIISSVTDSPYAGNAASIAEILSHADSEGLDIEKGIRSLVRTGANIIVQFGGSPVPEEMVRTLSPMNSTVPPHIVNFLDAEKEASEALLSALGEMVVIGIPLNLSPLFANAHVASLPSPPFPTRPYWVISKSHRAERTEILPPTIDVGTAAVSEPEEVESAFGAPISPGVASGNEIEPRQKVLDLIVQLTAFPMEGLKPELRFGADLGFDSLMWMDLYDALLAAVPETRDLPESLIRADTTVGDLMREVSAVVNHREAQGPGVKDEIQRYVVVPVEQQISNRLPGPPAFAGPVAMVPDELGVAPILTRLLQRAGCEVRTVLPEEKFVREGARALIDLSGLDSAENGDDAGAFRRPVVATLRRASAMAADGIPPSAFVTIHAGVQNAGMAGVALALAREWPEAFVRSVEIAGGTAAEVIAERVFQELAGKKQTVEVSYASGSRQLPALEKRSIEYLPLPEGAVVAISGGGRGLGAKLAEELARRHKARLLLLGRSPDSENTIQSVLEAGGNALYIKCDVRNKSEVCAAFERCREKFGPIQYVVHAAGVLADGPIGSKDLDRAAVVFDTKVAGCLALWEAAKSDPLRTFLIYGSWAGRFGNAFQSDYSAANHLLGRLASVLAAKRSMVRVITMDLPPWEGSGMINGLPESVRQALGSRVRFLDDETGLSHVISELGAEGASGEIVIGAGLEEKLATECSVITVSRADQPWLDDHQLDGRILVPLAVSLDYAAAAARLGMGRGFALSEVIASEVFQVPEAGPLQLEIAAHSNHKATEIEISRLDHGRRHPSVSLKATAASEPLAGLTLPPGGKSPELPIAEFYQRLNFHGPRFRALTSVLEVGPTHVAGLMRAPGSMDGPEGAVLDVLCLDGMMQLCAYWALVNLGVTGLPVGADEIRVLARAQAGEELRITGLLQTTADGVLTSDLDLLDAEGRALIQVRGLSCKMVQRRAKPHANGHDHAAALTKIDSSSWRIDEFPEVKVLRDVVRSARLMGIESPYFSVHERVTNETSVIDGREYANFSSYNYLGLSGDPEVSAAAVEAIARYGTSVSASRLVSGEKPLHGELEREIAEFLGCPDAVVFVSGHATNVSVIGHMFGPQDLVVHDSLAHDSILTGIRLSGAKRHAFPHNDPDALDQILRRTRQSARRVLIAVEAVYSMDGDIAPLARIIEVKRRHNAMLFVDEAHSLGVLGPSGRGIAEHCGINRGDAEFWMGTLSKSLASCGGYIAGSRELVHYLKHSNPGFVFSVGMSPANAAAALAALRKLRASPGLIATLRERSRLFLALSRERGINTGSSEGTPIIPCIVGNSMDSVRLSRAMAARGINVQPILHPAVEEQMSRLRFFITARHSEQQIRAATDALAEELERIDPRHPAFPAPVAPLRKAASLMGE